MQTNSEPTVSSAVQEVIAQDIPSQERRIKDFMAEIRSVCGKYEMGIVAIETTEGCRLSIVDSRLDKVMRLSLTRMNSIHEWGTMSGGMLSFYQKVEDANQEDELIRYMDVLGYEYYVKDKFFGIQYEFMKSQVGI